MRLLRKAIMLPSCNVKSHFQREAGMNHAPTPSRTRGSRRVKLRAETGFFILISPCQAQTEDVQPVGEHKVKCLVARREGSVTCGV